MYMKIFVLLVWKLHDSPLSQSIFIDFICFCKCLWEPSQIFFCELAEVWSFTAFNEFKGVFADRNPLKFTVGDEADVQLFPEPEEPVNILNIKRGIISALLVPLSEEEGEEEKEQSSTMVGHCKPSQTRQEVPMRFYTATV